jgi:hypothetical protein
MTDQNNTKVNNIHFLVNMLKTTGSRLDKETRKESNCANRRKIKLLLDLKVTVTVQDNGSSCYEET